MSMVYLEVINLLQEAIMLTRTSFLNIIHSFKIKLCHDTCMMNLFNHRTSKQHPTSWYWKKSLLGVNLVWGLSTIFTSQPHLGWLCVSTLLDFDWYMINSAYKFMLMISFCFTDVCIIHYIYQRQCLYKSFSVLEVIFLK